MKIFFYCQHVLGIGHFHRTLAICRELATRHDTTVILGGPPVEYNEKLISWIQLPGLEMNSEFQELAPCDPSLELEQVKEMRRKQLYETFERERPDIFITELYPFGRKAFRFELDPVLDGIKNGELSPCNCYCSVRDILVEKNSGRQKHELRAVERLNSCYQGILIHGDPQVIRLNETFTLCDKLTLLLHYTGYVTRDKPQEATRSEVRKRLKIPDNEQLLIVSIGSGSVGSELLEATVAALTLLPQKSTLHVQIFCGLYCPEDVYERLLSAQSETISVHRFSQDFLALLAAGDLSISMGGYNTSMNLLAAGIPALILPFDQNQEQRLRAERLSRLAPFIILNQDELVPEKLTTHIRNGLQLPLTPCKVDLDGAANSLTILEKLIES